MEYINCNLCGENKTEILFYGKDYRFYNLKEVFAIVKCKECGLVYLNPRPSYPDMKKYYPPIYYANGCSIVRSIRRLYLLREVKKLKGILGSNSKVLEIGCGNGEFLSLVKDVIRCQVYSIEPNLVACGIAKEKFGLDLFPGEIFEANFPSNFFDLVIMKYVIEHLHDPTKTLKEINRILKNGKMLYLWLPQIDTPEERIFGKYWFGYDAPRHLYNFSVKTVMKLLRSNGFEIVKLSFDFSSVQLVGSIRFFLIRIKAPKVIVDFFSPEKNFFLLGLFSPLTFLLAKIKKSSKIILLAQKWNR